MLPLVDLHCHLLAGLDDGPTSQDMAVEMCRIAWREGTRLIAATAHQNPRWPAATSDAIRTGTRELVERLRGEQIGMTLCPSAEILLRPDIEEAWRNGEFLTIADRGQWILLELPHQLVLDVEHLVRALMDLGAQPILAHAERYPELLLEPGRIEALIKMGCLVQCSAHSLTDPLRFEERRALRDWFRRGVVHVLGSDGHSAHRRPPLMAAAYRQIARWAGEPAADRICSTNSLAVVHSLPFRASPPAPRKRRWFALW